MRRHSSISRSRLTGFTLLELLVGMGASAVLMASIVASSVTLQRSFLWSANYSEQSNAQLRVLDFVTRDIRRARAVSIDSTAGTLTLELPDTYSTYDAQGNPTSAVITPTIVHGVPSYGAAGQSVVVTYYRNNEALMRSQYVTSSGITTDLLIANGIRSFQAGLVGGGNLVRSTVTFRPRLRGDNASENRTAMSATVAARPMRDKLETSGSP